MISSRRQFLASSLAAVTSAAVSGGANSADESSGNPLCVFTKPFNSLSFTDLAGSVAELGLQGIEAPIRAGGHVEPTQVADKLPELVAALKARDLQITVMTSDINDPADPLTESVLRTAAKLGVRYYRMKYFKYDEAKPIPDQITEWRKQLIDLAAMNRDLGITGLYQNHAGRNYFGAPIWDLHQALDGIDPTHLGMAYDIRHATVEGGTSWPIGFQLMRPHVQVVYVKDFVWGKTKPENVPLGQGRVDAKFFPLLAKSNFTGPISLHEEYLDHRKPELVDQHWQAIEADVKTLRSWL